MILSRWDALVGHMVHDGYEETYHIRIKCERCGSEEFSHLNPPHEDWVNPATILRVFVVRCARCGTIAATVARTNVFGGGRE